MKIVYLNIEITQVTELGYIDEMVVFENIEETLQVNVDMLIKKLKGLTMECNTENTKTMTNNITIRGKDIKKVNTFKYLGGIINDKGNFEYEI